MSEARGIAVDLAFLAVEKHTQIGDTVSVHCATPLADTAICARRNDVAGPMLKEMSLLDKGHET